MAASSEMARLKREIEGLARALRPPRAGDRVAMGDSERRALRSEIDSCIRALDEIRDRLAG